jgi:Flp pilus assembly protein TadD
MPDSEALVGKFQAAILNLGLGLKHLNKLVESRLQRAAQAKMAGPGAPALGARACGRLTSGGRVHLAGALVLGALGLGACANDPPQQTSYVMHQRPQVATADGTPQRFTPPTDPSQDTPLAKTTPRENALTMGRMAHRSAEEGNLEGAAQLYRRSLALEPNNLPVTLGLAEALYRMDDFRSALETYRQALRLDPVNDEAMRGMGKTLIALDRPKEAIETYHKAAVRQPRDARIYNGLGVGMDMTGDHGAAQQKYRQALTLAPDDPNVQNNLALSLALSGQYTQSIEIFDKLVASPRVTARNRQNLALVYGIMGNEERAAYYARQDLDPAQVQRNLAYYAQLRASTDKARSAAAFGIDSRPGVPQLPAPDTMRPAPPRPSTSSDYQPVPPLSAIAPAAGAPMAAAVAPTLRVPTEPASTASTGATPVKESAAREPAAPRKAEVVEATAGTVEAEPSSLRSFLSKVLSAPAEQPAGSTAIAAGDDPERSIENHQPK